jgi:hypothetical protein
MVKTDYDGMNCCTVSKAKNNKTQHQKCLTAPGLARGGAGANKWKRDVKYD